MNTKLLFLIILFTTIGVVKAQDFTIDGINYTITDANNLTVKVAISSCYTGDLDLASTIDYNGTTYTLTSIDEYAFMSCVSLKSIIIPSTITTIKKGVFWGSGVTNVQLPNNITSIGESAFEKCTSLKNINFPNGLTSIGEKAFERCESLTNVTFPESITSIGENAFYYCNSFTSITIPNSITVINNGAFDRCENVTSITLPNSLTSIGTSAFGASYSLTNITFPNTLKSIGDQSFEGSALVSVNIPNTVTFIGDQAFSECESLSTVTLPNNISELGSSCFDRCINLTTINIPNSIFSLGEGTFEGCTALENISLSSSLTTIDDSLFKDCTSLKSISLPNNVTYVGFSAFENSGITDLTIPNSVNLIENGAFEDCTSLVSIIMPENITIINNGSFRNCTSLASVTLPEGLLQIDVEAFLGCSSLEKINLPESITEIKYAAFGNTILNEVTVNWNNPYIPTSNIFTNTNISLATLKVPQNTKTLYEVADIWKDFGTILEEGTQVSNYTSIPDTNFEQYLIDESIDSDEVINGQVLTADIENTVSLDLTNKNITNLTGIKDFTSLTSLNATNNNIASIDVSENILLESLLISQNQLNIIDISKNINLKNINLADNQLATLDVSENIKLESLDCGQNELTNLNVDNNTLLTALVCNLNQLTTLNLYSNINLENLNCEQNSITYLDLSKNNKLTKVACNDNALIGLNMQNGNNNQVLNENFSAFANPNLVCILVDDKNYSDNNWSQIDMQTEFSTMCTEFVTIPDANFEAHLESINVGNGIVGDNLANKDLIEDLTSLNIASKNINDTSGIEYFTNLTFLDISDNGLNQIDLSKNILLETFISDFNQFATFNFAQNTKLKTIEARNNLISTIDISTLVDLERLELESNQITTLDVTLNTKISILDLKNNQLENLDLSNQSQLVIFEANNNLLRFINLKNTANPTISTLETTNNPNLTCIEVLNIDYFDTISPSIDPQTKFYENCPSTTAIPDANFEAYLESINVGNGIVNDGFVITEAIEAITNLNIESKNISDLTGIQDFKNLTELNARNNNLMQIDVSDNILLENINVENNQLTTIDFSNNVSLKDINIGDNQLTNLDIHLLENLENLQCYKNQLTSINLISNKKLRSFVANENQLKQVDIRVNTDLIWIDVDDNGLESLTIKNGNNTNIAQFSATGNPNLACIEVDDVGFSETNWTAKDATATFSPDCAPANDDCFFAIPLVLGQETPGDINSGTFNNATDCVAGTIIADVWYSITVPETGEFSIEGSGFGGLLKFAIYETCASTSSISCGVNISLTNLSPGTVYYLKVWMEAALGKSQNQSETGTFTLTASDSGVLSASDFNKEKFSVLMYPNPTSKFVNIKMMDNKTLETIDIYNFIGKKVISQNTNNQENIKINLSTLSTGIYMVRVKSGDEIILKKLIIN